jgi:hypothetical protein
MASVLLWTRRTCPDPTRKALSTQPETAGFTPSLQHLRCRTTWENAGELGAQPSISDNDEVFGGSVLFCLASPIQCALSGEF